MVFRYKPARGGNTVQFPAGMWKKGGALKIFRLMTQPTYGRTVKKGSAKREGILVKVSNLMPVRTFFSESLR